MIREAHYREKLAHRARGLAQLDRLVGGVDADIDARLGRRRPVRILELGCGYGTALLELGARYGAEVELHGLNRHPEDGDRDILLRNAADRGIVGLDGAPPVLPELHFADVADGLPFAERSFDLVYSQVAWLYFGNKLAVLKETMRVLADDGIAKIDADELRPGLPPELGRLVEIWDAGRLLPLRDYGARFGVELRPADEGEYLRFGRCAGFADDVELVFELDVSRVHADWDGIKCVYRTIAGESDAPPREASAASAAAAPSGRSSAARSP
jgi:SAM-dependent methyltransferase